LKNKVKSLEIIEFGGKKTVKSLVFYKATGLRRENYTRWLTETVLLIGRPGVDYFAAPENVAGRTIRFRLRYYFELEFAIGICLVVKRKEALAMREFLIDCRDNQNTKQA
jgi:hypothetical protein